MQSKLNHFAINTDNVAVTQEFYGSVFGWTFRAYGPDGFVQILDENGTKPMGAIQQRRELINDTTTTGYECTFGVDDIKQVRERIVGAGGTILMDITAIPNVGKLLAFEDPGGNPVLAMEYNNVDK